MDSCLPLALCVVSGEVMNAVSQGVEPPLCGVLLCLHGNESVVTLEAPVGDASQAVSQLSPVKKDWDNTFGAAWGFSHSVTPVLVGTEQSEEDVK